MKKIFCLILISFVSFSLFATQEVETVKQMMGDTAYHQKRYFGVIIPLIIVIVSVFFIWPVFFNKSFSKTADFFSAKLNSLFPGKSKPAGVKK